MPGSPATGPPAGYSSYNPRTGAIYMWPGQRPSSMPRPPAGPVQSPQAFLAGPPGQWAGQWGVPLASYGPPQATWARPRRLRSRINRPLPPIFKPSPSNSRRSTSGISTPVLPVTWHLMPVLSLAPFLHGIPHLILLSVTGISSPSLPLAQLTFLITYLLIMSLFLLPLLKI
jgi:hypothetical protein